MEFVREIISNFIANVFFWLTIGSITLLAIYIQQNKFLGFFGLRKNRRLIVYLSNLWQQGSGNPQGAVLSGHEFKVSRTISNFFRGTPFQFPEIVRGLVDNFWIGNKLQVEVRVSPVEPTEIEFSNLIVVGGSPKNYVRQYYLKEDLHFLRIGGERSEPIDDVFEKVLSPSLIICKGQEKDQVVSDKYNVAIVEKILDEEHGTTVFFCLGYRWDSSWAAVEYLTQNWRLLNRQFGNSCFAIGLGFPMFDKYMDSYVTPIILEKFPKKKYLD